MNARSLVTTTTLLLLFALPLTARAQFPSGSQGPQNPKGQKIVMMVMKDGSVRPVVVSGPGAIDPEVLEMMRKSPDGVGSRPQFDARVGDGGRPAWVKTWNGLDPDLKRLWNMEQTYAGTGVMIYSYQAIDVKGSKATPKEMFDRLKTFELFNVNETNVAEVKLVKARPDVDSRFTGRQFATFRAKSEYPGLVGVLNGLQEFNNSRWVPVELFYDEKNMTITGVTMGDHMIVGVRRWTVVPQKDGTMRIETEAWETRNGSINDIAMRKGVPGVLTGKEVMGMVWNLYLANIGKAATKDGGTFDYSAGTNGKAGLWRELPEGTTNPFKAGVPKFREAYGNTRGSLPNEPDGVHPGTKVAPGFYGPSWTPPPPPVVIPPAPKAVSFKKDVDVIRNFGRINTAVCHDQSKKPTDYKLDLTGFGGPGFNGGRGDNSKILDAIINGKPMGPAGFNRKP